MAQLHGCRSRVGEGGRSSLKGVGRRWAGGVGGGMQRGLQCAVLKREADVGGSRLEGMCGGGRMCEGCGVDGLRRLWRWVGEKRGWG